MFGDLWGILASGGLIIVGLLVAWITGKAKGSATAKVEAAEQRTEDHNAIAAEILIKNQQAIAEQNKATVSANEIDEDVARMSDDSILNELYNRRTSETDSSNSDKK